MEDILGGGAMEYFVNAARLGGDDEKNRVDLISKSCMRNNDLWKKIISSKSGQK